MGSSGEIICFCFVPSRRVRTRTRTFFFVRSAGNSSADGLGCLSSSAANEARLVATVKIGSDFRFRLISRDEDSASIGRGRYSGSELGSLPSLLNALFCDTSYKLVQKIKYLSSQAWRKIIKLTRAFITSQVTTQRRRRKRRNIKERLCTLHWQWKDYVHCIGSEVKKNWLSLTSNNLIFVFAFWQLLLSYNLLKRSYVLP